MADIEPLGTWEMLSYAAKVLVALMIIVPALYYCLRFFGRRLQANRSMRGYMAVIDVLPLPGGKQLLLVRLGMQTLLLASAKEQLTLICEVPHGVLPDTGVPTEGHDLDSLKQWIKRWRPKGDEDQGV